MKQYVKHVTVVKKLIDIVVNLDDYTITDPVVAALAANTFQPSIKKQNKLSDEALQLYTDFINSVLQIIDNYKLKIVNHYQSKKAYTYYINVHHYVYEDDISVLYDITFRINNHVNYSICRKPSVSNDDMAVVPVIKSIQLGKYEATLYNKALIHLNKVCKSIFENDELVFQTDLTIFN